MKKTGFVLLVLSAVCASGEALDSLKSRALALEFTGANGKVLKYSLVEKPPSDGSKVPLIFFFHGAGQRGDDNTAQLNNLPDIVTWLDANESGFKLVAGQVPSGKLWVDVKWDSLAHTMSTEPSESMGLALELMDEFLEDQAIDTNRVYATGLSMGGYGTWDAISRRPEVFAAALPICGGADVAQATKLTAMPIWAFHGSKDGSVPVFRSRSMMSALWNAGADAHYWEYPDAPHDVWSRTYRNNDVLKWFFSQNKATATGGSGDVPVIGPVENNLGDVRLESESFTLTALSSGALTDHAETFTIAPGASKGGLDRIVAKGGNGYANAHLDIHEFFRESNAVLAIHAAENLLGQKALGTATAVNITCSYGVNTIGSGAEGTTSVPVVPWARGALSSEDKDAVWTQLVTYGDNGFRFLDPESEYETVPSATESPYEPVEGVNLRVTAVGAVEIAGGCTVNSFSMLSTNAATVTVSGGIMAIASGVLDLSVWNTVTVEGDFDFGDATGYITQCANKSATLKGSIAGRDIVFADNVLVYTSGNAPLAVKSTGTFTGDLYINGLASIDTPSFLPSGTRKGNVYVNGKFLPNGGTINGLFGNGIVDKAYTGTATLSIGDNDADGDFGGTIKNSKGNFNFTKIGAGTQRLGGPVTIGGDFRVNGGTLLLEGSISAKSVAVANASQLIVNLPAKSGGDAVKVVSTTTAMDISHFTKGENVHSLELREDGTELWATPKVSGFFVKIAAN
ncbi:MAG: prolyl oligopeptidase family serine peptidase [Kiritimatiellae bacterium]|nr:prolyl oligopeptidase family serine peptidase [Kiritimatiellia bacterium]